MSTPASALLLICPTCGKKYSGDPAKPDARYVCPADQTALVKFDPEPVVPPPQPTPEPTQQTPAQPQQQTFVLGSDQQTTDPGTGTVEEPPRTQLITPPTASGATTLSTGTIREERPSVLGLLKVSSSAGAALSSSETKYEQVGKLGEGGMGEVLKVRDRDLKREVALKRLRQQPNDPSDDALLRFVEEAQATGQLEHPNIVPVHDLGIDGEGRVYFTLKYVQGVSLKQVINGRQAGIRMDDGVTEFRDEYSPLRMIEVLIGVCQGVAYAHNKGIIHRDLKPENIMLGKFGEALVMDWGLAKVLRQPEKKRDTVRITTSRADQSDSQTMEGSIAGTPAYMAPEQAEGRISELDERTDIYSLGAILYEILSGEAPYRGVNALDTLRQVTEGPPKPIKKGSFGFDPVPRELRAICEKAMARSPFDRYASAIDLRDDLQAYLENRPVTAAPDNALQRAAKWARRNRRQVTAAAASAALVLALVSLSYFGYRFGKVRSLLNQSEAQFASAKDAFQKNKTALGKVPESDPYAMQLSGSTKAESARVYRAGLNAAAEPLRRVLDIDPSHSTARAQLAAIYMELWRLALDENNTELMKATRAEATRYAPEPNPYLDELNGFGKITLTLTPASAEAYIFKYEPLRFVDKDGNAQPARLIPVPFDPKKKETDAEFLKSEQERAKSGAALGPEHALPGGHPSIFRLDPTPASLLGKGNIEVAGLPPGSYLLLLRAPGRLDTRMPVRIDRRGEVKREFELPELTAIPPGFFFFAGGNVVTGGDTAGAPAPGKRDLLPSLIFHDEISMGEYADFLQDLTRRGKAAEARRRLPRDFGKPLAQLTRIGLVPAGQPDVDFLAFAKTPVRGVSYEDAMAYIKWRSDKDGLPYRLPREWEWEGACRGADGRKYSWGDQPGKGFAVVTQGYGDNGLEMSWAWPDYKDESPYGLHNMAGGAAEWTATLYDPKAKPSDPVYGQYAIRGNAWALPPVGLECAFRTSGQPAYFHPTIGFRMALDWPIKGARAAAAVAHH